LRATDVVIVGAGPNGLLMACELALAGIRPIVIEQLSEPDRMPKANGLVGQVVQALDYRGLYQKFTGNHEPPQPSLGFQFGALSLHDQPVHLLPIPQRRIEELLEERAGELGTEIRRGQTVTSLSQNSDSVTVEVTGPDGSYRLATSFVVAADGGRSEIRKQLGIGFPGFTDNGFVGLMGQAAFLPPAAQPESGELEVPGIGRLKHATFIRTEIGMFGFGMFQPGVYRFGVYEWGWPPMDANASVTIGEANAMLSRVLGAPIEVAEPPKPHDLMLRRSDGINSRQADRYRFGRVFLVGDAAHVHSGVGGPGLNLGMQDVFNLGWKLAAAIKGWAPPDLLDSYEAERRPVGERVIMHTRAQTALLSPGPNITGLRQVFEELLKTPDNARHIMRMMTGADVRYAYKDQGQNAPSLVGGWMPDVKLQTGYGEVRFAELMRAGNPILLDASDNAELGRHATPWIDRVTVVHARADATSSSVLVRPDGYVAWAPDAPNCAAGLNAALEKWFGAPDRRLTLRA
jgi:2-polyprenyl-6-methoxyphenol hydroxylase-like FAD-dependent oxidoreductase